MSGHWKLFAAILIASLVMDAILGAVFAHVEHLPTWHGMFCAQADSETLGGDCSITRAAGYVVKYLELVVAIPLAGSVLGLFTSGITAFHTRRHVNNAITEHVDRAIREIKAHHDRTCGVSSGVTPPAGSEAASEPGNQAAV